MKLMRLLILLAATLVAVLLLATTLLFGPSRGSVTIVQELDIDDIDLPAGTGMGERGEYVFVEDGRVVIMMYDRVVAQPDDLLNVTGPSARIVFAPNRVLRIDADYADIVAPEGRLLTGHFQGNVVATVYEASEGTEVRFDNTNHIQLRVYLDDADFDQQTGMLESKGELHLTTPNIDMTGQGLRLTFNPLRERLQRLVVHKGHELRLNPITPTRETPSQPATTASSTSQPRSTTSTTEQATTFYEASFAENVRVNVGYGRATLAGDSVEIVFAGDTQALTPSQDEVRSTADATPSDQPSRTEQADASEQPDVQLKPAENPRSLTPTSQQDIVVHWDGPLTIAPMMEQPSDILDARDVLIAMSGSPVHISTDQEETVEAARVDYLVSNGRIRAFDSESHAVMLDSPRLGIVTGKQLQVVQDTAEGYILGPGTLLAASSDRDNPNAPKDLIVRWSDRLNLQFDVSQSQAGNDSALDQIQAARLEAIRVADFIGQVEVSHPQFKSASDRMTLRLDPVNGGEPQLSSIELSGHAHMQSLSDDLERQLDLKAEEITLSLKPGVNGQPEPDRMVAEGKVHAVRPGYELKSDHLYTVFQEQSFGEGDFEIHRVLAQGNVEISAEDQETRLTGDRMIADVPNDRVELLGLNDRLAIVHRPDGELRAAHLLLDQATNALQVTGRGDADLAMNPGQPEDRLFIQWQKSMTYDTEKQSLQFTGDVRTRTQAASESTRMRCDELTLQFDSEDDAPQRATDDGRRGMGVQSVREGVARGNVVFEAEQLNGDAVMTRMQLRGPVARFLNETQVVRVDGEGTLLIEDRRPAPASQPSRVASSDGVAITGRGATLFLWNENFTLNARNNNMLLRGGVQMVHEPTGGQAADQVKLVCDILLADLEETGGMGVWSTEDGSEPTLTQIMATGDVRLWQGRRQIFADELLYTEPTQTVEISAHEGRLARVLPGDQPQTLAAEKIKWDLSRDRFDILKPGTGGGVPVPGGR